MTYWYRTTTEECVLCGRTHRWRERVTGVKPLEAALRYIFRQFACGEHFC